MSESRLVYTSDSGRMCPDCQKPVSNCKCRKDKSGSARPQNSPKDGIARVKREVNGRGGKTVSVIDGLPVGEEKMKEISALLKRRCGTGGTVKDGVIIIQGDHRETLIEELQKLGFPAKRSGG